MLNSFFFGTNRGTLKTIPDKSVNCCVTSPPYYGLRDYGIDNQIGLEETPEEYIDNLVYVFREVKRILRDDGTLWVNIGDRYAKSGLNKSKIKIKDLIGIPWMLAFALRDDGWYLRQDIIWYKSNPMPESVKDRCTNAHEHIFLLSKSRRYYFNIDSNKEKAIQSTTGASTSFKRENSKRGIEGVCPGKMATHRPDREDIMYDGEYRNRHNVWKVGIAALKYNHFAIYPKKLILPCILCGCPENGVVLDPFMGSGTTGLVAIKNFRKYIGCEINPEYKEIAEKRIAGEWGLFNE
ncbi:MAG: site-specific DNA-methyltransferase [Treponema sp.]|nr:site-specific DNA-methyltransferase [Treponema sp.]